LKNVFDKIVGDLLDLSPHVKIDISRFRLSLRQIFVADLSATCRRPAQNTSETWSETRFKQVFDEIDVMEFGLKL